MLRKLFIGVIKFYQRFISPHKGFRCAYSVYHQSESCSTAAVNILQQNQSIKISIQDIQTRLVACRQANVALQNLKEKEKENQKKSNACAYSLQTADCMSSSCITGCNAGDACSSGIGISACSCN